MHQGVNMKKIIEDEGLILLSDGNNYYIEYESGELMVKQKRIKITLEEAEVIKLSPDIMYDIMIGYQDNGVYGEEVKECEALDLLTD